MDAYQLKTTIKNAVVEALNDEKTYTIILKMQDKKGNFTGKTRDFVKDDGWKPMSLKEAQTVISKFPRWEQVGMYTKEIY